jgi:hypothetical protein
VSANPNIAELLSSEQPKTKISERQLALRRQLWPETGENDLWLRKRTKGFTTIPRTMPLIMAAMDALSPGKPVSSAYLDLWCRAFDECIVVLNRHTEMAFGSGFGGQRAEQTWLGRIKILESLGFIKTQPGPSGPYSYALILNPLKVIMKHQAAGTPGLNLDLFNALRARATEIGAEDFLHVEKLTELSVAVADPDWK